MQFDYRVVFLKQSGFPACAAMESVWYSAANELNEEYPYYNIGFGEWNNSDDDWAFATSIGCDSTPNFAVFDTEANLLGLQEDGIISKSELKDFVIKAIEG